ncbi:MAG: Fimbrial assembly family protein [Pedosphaera sp.]|nr:Fimbrial assembly family protein [Pedosphaera sp.]
MGEKLKKTRWQSCNVLQVGADSRQVWGFAAGKNGFNLTEEASVSIAEPLPQKLVAKDWKVLFQPKLNIALLPIDKVFLRVIQLPVGSFDETASMVELQLEKLSPLAVTQIVWSIHVIPNAVDNLQTVIVVIVARDLVEELLGQLEGQGFLADRIEVPMIDQLQATAITADGAWIYPNRGTGKFTALVAWWYGGVLRNLGLLHVPATENRSDLLKEQLSQMAWAGELEGWLISEPRWHLVADELAVAIWQPMFQAGLGHAIQVVPPLSPEHLAALTANRSAQAEPKTNILPVEYSSRYQQQYYDRLWMRGLFAILALYVIGAVIYLAGAGVQSYRAGRVEGEVKGISKNYTNVLQMKAKLQILQDRQALKFAALDCWKTVAELLPENLTLQQMDFKNGKILRLNGAAPEGNLVTDFNESLRKVKLKNSSQLMFDKVELPIVKLNPGGGSVSWNFTAELARAEETQ